MKSPKRWQRRIAGFISIVVLIAGAYGIKLFTDVPGEPTGSAGSDFSPTATSADALPHDRAVVQAFERESSDLLITSGGIVTRVLPDDNDGSRHQRFIIETRSGHTLLVAHNIDLADRVPVAVDDVITFHGEYEWNEQGGVIHWTHRDPRQWREDGWIEHNGQRYW